MKSLALLIALTYSTFSIGQSWQDVGGGTNNSSHGMLTWNGKLINLGSFNNPCNRVAEWDGTSWNCLGPGVGIVARAGVVWDGKLVVVGDFWNVQQPCVGCNGVAVWDGVSWSPLGTGVNNDVLSCTVWNNELVIAGDFTQADGTPCARIVKWNGVTWESVGPIGSFDNDIRAMVEFEGELWVGGDFNNVGGNPPLDGLVKYDPNTGGWAGGNSGVDLIGGVNETVRVLYVNPNDGNLYMGGEFPELWDGDAAAQDFNMSGIAMYDGSNWTPLGTGLNEYCRAMHEYNGDIVAGGYFTNAGGTAANKIAKWNGTSWSAMGQGFDASGVDEYVKSAAVWNGTFFAGGAYTQAEGNPMNYIAQWYEPVTSAPVAWMNSSSTSLCGSGCIDFLDNSTNAPTSWNWTFPGSNIPTSTQQDPGTVCWSSPGTYTVSLQACNAIGCTTQDIDIIVENGATVSVNDASICGGGPETLTATPSVSGGTFLWSPGGETTSSITVNPGSSTSYTVTYSYLGCTSSATSNVTVGTGPNVTVSGGNSICEGQSVILTATPSITGGTYLWSPGGQTTQSITVSPTSSTDYTVEYTLNGCSSTPVIETVTVNPTPTVSIADESICNGGSATLTATPSSPGGSYLWSPGGQTTASITESPINTTTYTVVYTLNGCSSASEPGTISVGTTPNVSVNNEIICDGETASLIATPSQPGGTYFWLPGGETTASIDVTPGSTSNYTVEYTLNGCTSSPETSTVTVNPTPSVSVNSPSICDGNSATLIATPSTGGGTYLWSPGNQTTPTISISPNSTTTYNVTYTLNGCDSPAEVSTVTVNPTPTISVTNETICNGGSATLTATPSIGGGTYLWSPGNETTPSITYSPTTTTPYSVVYTLNGCPSSAQTGTITVGITPTISLSNNISICEGQSTDLVATPSTTGGTYVWTPGGQTGATATVSPILTTTYSVIYTLNGCPSNTESVTVTVNATPNVTVDNFTICSGDSATLTATPSNGGGSYLWSPGNETTPSITYSPTSTTSYSVVYTLNGCDSPSESGTITVNPTPTLSLNDITICLGNNGTLTAVPDITGGTYLWSPGNETTATITVNPSSTTTYSVVYTLNGCESITTTGTVDVISTPDNSVIEANNVLTAQQLGAVYQWIDCNNGNTPISGETNQTFTPTENGLYAVIIDLGGCIDTSDCIIISTIGLNELNELGFSVYPNPTTGDVHLIGSGTPILGKYNIIDASGRTLLSGNLNEQQIINIQELSPGPYVLIIEGELSGQIRIIKE